MRITSEGRITIPAKLRERLGMHPGIEVEIIATSEGLLIRKIADRRMMSGRALVEHLRGKATRRLTTDEIMEMTRGE